MSGAGNVAQHCAAKLLELGAVVLAMSDSRGCIFKPSGLTQQDLNQVGRESRRLRESARSLGTMLGAARHGTHTGIYSLAGS